MILMMNGVLEFFWLAVIFVSLGTGTVSTEKTGIVECPRAGDGSPQHVCPSVGSSGIFECIDDYMLCDNVRNCPGAEDESRVDCMFHNSLKAQVKLLEKIISKIVRQPSPKRSVGALQYTKKAFKSRRIL